MQKFVCWTYAIRAVIQFIQFRFTPESNCFGAVRLLKQEKGKITFSLKEETLSVYPLTENSIRVIKQREITHHTPELIYTPVSSYPRYELEKSISDSLTYANDRFRARYFILMGHELFKYLVEPVVYSRDEIIAYQSASNVSSFVNSKYLEIQDIFFKKNNPTINDFLVINGVYTDILKTEASLFRKEIEMIKPYLSTDCIVLKNNTKLTVLKIIFDERTQSVRALNVISGQEHSEIELLSMVRSIYEY